MGGSWKLGKIRGIELRLHATFVILVVWLALAFYRQAGSAAAARGVLFILSLFASVVVHELGHALAARRFGVPTKDITLLPIGGVARLEYIPDRPKQELFIALAGPAVTLGLVIVLYIVLRASGLPTLPSATMQAGPAWGVFLAQLMWVNSTLFLFNILPAFPMDGGRVLRAVLALRMDYLRATDVAARFGRWFAFLFGIVGLFYNPFLVLIALFVWLGAAGESSAVHVRSSLAGVNVGRVMVSDIQTLSPNDTLDAALQHVLGGFQHDFPVVDGDRVIGVLTQRALLTGLAKQGTASKVGDSMEQSFRVAEPNEPVQAAIARLHECRCRSLPVVRDGTLHGMLTLDNIGEFVMIRSAIRGSVMTRPAV